ncbi:hypothetical protein QBC35DRAFT_146685 [Podospora australis]|uniref:NAD dependent epimerase/dehydratase n=1 Tax=Podospora australis TaxID=1536484 RepID=A0AAN6WXL2_9PEZI|nr:hypothetical protein QBC35DRAFT_146685 [Podospora australis]
MFPSLNSYYWHFLENYLFRGPSPPPRVRTKPLEVICVGLPRSGTESLQHALIRLGYDHTFHGWDIVYEEPSYCREWVKLCRKKWFGPFSGTQTFTPADFDPLIGHSVAVTDAAASVFAAELITAYPDAKVILNYRKDVEAWHRSVTTTLVRAQHQWLLFFMSCLHSDCFWAWHVFVRFMWPGLFRALDGNIETGVCRNGRWVAREHHAMIRGLVPPRKLLEWTVEDGWAPLCKFLDKPVPENEPFPHVNAAAGWEGHEKRLAKKYILGVLRNLSVVLLVIFAVLVGFRRM